MNKTNEIIPNPRGILSVIRSPKYFFWIKKEAVIQPRDIIIKLENNKMTKSLIIRLSYYQVLRCVELNGFTTLDNGGCRTHQTNLPC